MILSKIEQLNPKDLRLLINLYFHLDEYLELIWPHPSRVGFGGRLYLTNKEDSQLQLNAAWDNFQKAAIENTFQQKEIFFEAEVDYKETLRIAGALIGTKQITITRKKIEKESFDMQEKLQKISIALMKREAKLSMALKQK